MKPWLEGNDIEIYSIHNEEKSVVTKRFLRTLKYNIYRYMTSTSENVYVPWAYLIKDLKDQEFVETFYEKELQKENQKEFRT